MNQQEIDTSHWNLGRMFGFLTKQYIGYLTKRLEHIPIDRNYFTLHLIGKNSGKMSQQQLADQLLTDKVCLVRVLDNLMDDGFIERKVNPNDRRQHLLYITAEGERWVNEIESGINETDHFFLNSLPENQRELFQVQLQQLIHTTKNIPVEEVELFYNRIKDIPNE